MAMQACELGSARRPWRILWVALALGTGACALVLLAGPAVAAEPPDSEPLDELEPSATVEEAPETTPEADPATEAEADPSDDTTDDTTDDTGDEPETSEATGPRPEATDDPPSSGTATTDASSTSPPPADAPDDTESLAAASASEPALTTAVEAPDCPQCSSRIDQHLVERTFEGDRWELVIEAVLDSNVVCHVLLFQCVVQPEQEPTNMTLVGVECLSPGWALVYVNVFGFQRLVCARFDHHHAGTDQRFRFTYRTDPGVTTGTVTETVHFYRFPEEIFFLRAQDTITIDLDAELDLAKSCPDTVAAGASAQCSVTLDNPGSDDAPGTVVTETPPAEFQNGTLTPTVDPGSWSCLGLTCTYTANGGAFPGGSTEVFTFAFDVAAGSDGEVTNQADATWASGVASASANVTIVSTTDTTLTIDKVANTSNPQPGGPISWTITVTNEGPVDAINVRVLDTPSAFVQGASLTFASGVGSWSCAGLECTAATMPLGTATFTVSGVLSPATPPGTVIFNEADVEWDNDVFGPDFPIRVGSAVAVAPSPTPPGPEPTPAPTGGATDAGSGTGADTLPRTGGGVGMLALVGLGLLVAGSGMRRLARPRG